MTKPLHLKDLATIKEVVLHMQQHTPGLTLQEYVTGCVLNYTQAVIKELGIAKGEGDSGG
jgi:hypothetical protein